MPVPVPAGVQVVIEGSKVTVKGPKGQLTQEVAGEKHHEISGVI